VELSSWRWRWSGRVKQVPQGLKPEFMEGFSAGPEALLHPEPEFSQDPRAESRREARPEFRRKPRPEFSAYLSTNLANIRAGSIAMKIP
jgi:hypothetical protein